MPRRPWTASVLRKFSSTWLAQSLQEPINQLNFLVVGHECRCEHILEVWHFVEHFGDKAVELGERCFELAIGSRLAQRARGIEQCPRVQLRHLLGSNVDPPGIGELRIGRRLDQRNTNIEVKILGLEDHKISWRLGPFIANLPIAS